MKKGLEIDKYGAKFYYLNDQLHRDDGPAIEYPNGDKFWYKKDQSHRLDGPAIELCNGNKFWYYEGTIINCASQEEFEKILKLKLFW